jgi:hypothetical protein
MDPNAPQVVDEAVASQELMITRIENTMAGLEESNLQNDSRYQQMDYLKQKLQGNQNVVLKKAETSSTEAEKQKTLTESQLKKLQAQIAAYRMLARNEPVPAQLMSHATHSNLPPAFEHPKDLSDGEKLPYDLMRVLGLHIHRTSNRQTALPTPPGIDPQALMKERENR